MKNHFLIPLMAGFLAALVSARANDRITNGSFETTLPNGLPDEWECYFPVPDASATFTRGQASIFETDSTVFHSGAMSFRIASPQPTRAAILQRAIPCRPGESFQFSVWMKAAGLDIGRDSGALARVAFLNSVRKEMNGPLTAHALKVTALAPDFDWQRMEVSGTVPADADLIQTELFLWKSKGAVWFDDTSLQFADPAPESLPSVDRAAKNRYRSANAALSAGPQTNRQVVFLGDSIIANWKLAASFPNQPFINRGIGGQQTWQLLSRLQQDALDLKPTVLAVLAGTNDIAGDLPLDAILRNMRAIVQTSRRHNIRVIVCSATPVSDYNATSDHPEYARTTRRPPATLLEYNRGLAKIAQEEGALYVDLYRLLADKAGFLPADLSTDGLHPNAAGYDLIAPALLQAIQAGLNGEK